MLRSLRRRQTLASYDYQWNELAEGDAMLSDPWFQTHVDRILAEEMLCVERGWFRGRRVLDAGCGSGRWTLGFLRLGCDVTAVDSSRGALAALERSVHTLAPEALEQGRLATRRVDLLDLPDALSEQRFDVVHSFGVLHHTGDTRKALSGLVPLVAPSGFMFLYLYGSRSLDPLRWTVLMALRTLLAPLPFKLKRALLPRLLPGRDVHQAFDTFSPLINDTYTHATVEAWLHESGLSEVTRTIDYTELYLRAQRPGTVLPATPLPPRPYWFERYRRRPLPAGSAPPLR